MRDTRGRSPQNQIKNVGSSSWREEKQECWKCRYWAKQVHWGRLSSKDVEEIMLEVGRTKKEEVESETR